ncbi:terminase large subunit [Treponema putidum]|uniref:terminase large subunit n=1 Tax=Treponema putidum TaxID=221027 RepID=UPI003D92A7B3
MKHSTYYKQVIEYCNNIISKKIQAGQYTIKACKRFLNDLKKTKDEGCIFQFTESSFNEFCEFAEALYIPDTGEKLKLLSWQLFIYANLYGFTYKDNPDRRRYRQAYIEVARKNGKTTGLLFPQILYDFLTTNAAESYLVSKDGAQAEKSFKELKSIIDKDKDLKKICECFTNTIVYDTSRIAFFSSESTSIDGYKNSLSIIDEFHSYDSDKIVTSFRYGARARLNGLVVIITSAGLDISSPCYAESQKCKSILNGTLTDDSYFGIVYAYDEKDDWQDSNNFIKANPSLGTFLKKDILLSDLADAQITPSHQPDFKSKTCGIWTNDVQSWIPTNKLNTKYPIGSKIDYDILLSYPCYAALDLSSVNDMTALSLCWKYKNDYYFKHHFYIPESTVYERYKKENINILDWIDKGYITVIQGDIIDYEVIYQDILQLCDKFIVKEIAYDRWHSSSLINRVNETIPDILLIEYEQSLKNFAPPTKEYERLALNGNIVDPNPVLFWQLQNVRIKPDTNNNYKPLKDYKSSTKRIDGVITSIMALDRCRANENKIVKEVNFKDILNSF